MLATNLLGCVVRGDNGGDSGTVRAVALHGTDGHRLVLWLELEDGHLAQADAYNVMIVRTEVSS